MEDSILSEIKTDNIIVVIDDGCKYEISKERCKNLTLIVTMYEQDKEEKEFNIHVDKESFDQVLKYLDLNSKYKKPEIIKALETTDLYKIYDDDKVVNYVNELYSNKELYEKTLNAALYLGYVDLLDALVVRYSYEFKYICETYRDEDEKRKKLRRFVGVTDENDIVKPEHKEYEFKDGELAAMREENKNL